MLQIQSSLPHIPIIKWNSHKSHVFQSVTWRLSISQIERFSSSRRYFFICCMTGAAIVTRFYCCGRQVGWINLIIHILSLRRNVAQKASFGGALEYGTRRKSQKNFWQGERRRGISRCARVNLAPAKRCSLFGDSRPKFCWNFYMICGWKHAIRLCKFFCRNALIFCLLGWTCLELNFELELESSPHKF